MTKQHLTEIQKLVEDKLKEKLKTYKAETSYTPFFSAIFPQEVIVKASLMQSLYTSFGMSIYEQMAVILAKQAGYHAERQYKLLGEIDRDTANLIDDLCLNTKPDKDSEIAQIRSSIKPGNLLSDKESVVDVFIRRLDGSELCVDITTVKPNLKEFRSMRKKLLRWVALRLSVDKNVQIDTRIGIPYNPYYPNDYLRWTGNELTSKDLLVQNDLWAAFAGYDVYSELIEAFEEVGKRLNSHLAASKLL